MTPSNNPKREIIEEALKDWGFLAPLIGSINQGLYLFSLNAIYYFSWTQVISDSIVIILFIIAFVVGCAISSNIVKKMWIGFWLKILLGLGAVLIVGVIMASYVAYYFSGADYFLIIFYFSFGMLIGKFFIELRNYFHKITAVLLLATVFSIGNIWFIPPLKSETLIVNGNEPGEGYSYKLKYQNDRFMFGDPNNSESSIIVFTAGQENYRIRHARPSYSYKEIYSRFNAFVNDKILTDSNQSTSENSPVPPTQ